MIETFVEGMIVVVLPLQKTLVISQSGEDLLIAGRCIERRDRFAGYVRQGIFDGGPDLDAQH